MEPLFPLLVSLDFLVKFKVHFKKNFFCFYCSTSSWVNIRIQVEILKCLLNTVDPLIVFLCKQEIFREKKILKRYHHWPRVVAPDRIPSMGQI